MTDQNLEKYELKIENLPWINSNRDQKELEFVLNIDLPSESVKVVKIKEAGNCKDIAYVRCDSETTFKKVVEEFSEGPEKKVGGLLGPVPLSQPHPFLSKLLQISKPNQLWPPKKLDNWWIIVRCEKIHNTKLDDELKSKLALELGEEYLKNENT